MGAPVGIVLGVALGVAEGAVEGIAVGAAKGTDESDTAIPSVLIGEEDEEVVKRKRIR